jgi:hypothetical protein
MSTVIDELVVELQLDGTFARNEAEKIKRDTEKAAKEAGEEFKKTGDKAKEAGDKAKEGAKEAQSGWTNLAETLKSNMLSIASGAMALYGIGQAFTTYLSEADSLLKFSRAIGQNVEDIDAWGQAVKRSGGSAEGFQNSLKSLTVQLSKMSTTGNSRAGNILEGVGIDAGEIGRQRNSFEVLTDIADKMQEMSKEEAFGFGASLGLDSGTIMLLQQGRDGVADLVAKMKELGTITPDDTWVEDFNDSIDDIKKSFMSLAGIVFRTVGPAFNWLTQQIKQLNIWLRKHEVAVKAFFYMIAGLITALLIPTILSLFATLLSNPITWVVVGLVALAAVIEDLVVWANGGKSALSGLWEAIFGSPEEAKKTFADIKQSFEDFVKFMQTDGKEIAAPFIELGKTIASLPLDNLKSLATLIKDIKNGDYGDAFKQVFLMATKPAQILASIVGAFLEALANEAVLALQYFMDGVKQKVDDFIKWIKETVSNIFTADIDIEAPDLGNLFDGIEAPDLGNLFDGIEAPDLDGFFAGLDESFQKAMTDIQAWGNANFTPDSLGIDRFFAGLDDEISDAGKRLDNWLVSLQDWGNLNFESDFLGIDGFFAGIDDKIADTGKRFDHLLISLQDWGNQLPEISLDIDTSALDGAKKALADLIPADVIKQSITGINKAFGTMVPVEAVTSAVGAIKDFIITANADNEENTTSMIDTINGYCGESGAVITRIFRGVYDFLENGLSSLQSTASSVTSAISGFFADLAFSIRSAIGEAIDWALGKLASLATAIRNTPIVGGAVGSAIDYFSGGSTNNSNSSYSSSTSVGEINVYTQATDADGIADGIGGAVSNRFNYGFANGGVY